MNTSIECDVEIFAVETEAHYVPCDVGAEPTYVVNSIHFHSSYTSNETVPPGPLVPGTVSHSPRTPGAFRSLPTAPFWKRHHWSISSNFTKIWSWITPGARPLIHQRQVREYPTITKQRRVVLIRPNWKRDFHRSGIPDAPSHSLASKHNNLLFCKLRRMSTESYNISTVRVLKIRYFTSSDCLFRTLLTKL